MVADDRRVAVSALEWLLLAYGVLITVLFVIVDLSNVDLRREVNDLRRRIHPSSRKALQ